MPKGGKPYPKGKKPGRVLFLMLAVLLMAVPAMAGGLTIDEPYTLKYMLGLNTQAEDPANRGGSVSGVVGPLVAYKSDVSGNIPIELDVSFGVAVMPEDQVGTGQATDGTAGIGPCVLNRTVCAHAGYGVDLSTGKRDIRIDYKIDALYWLNQGARTIGIGQ